MVQLRFSALLLLVTYLTSTQALYFYLEGSEKKCFIEDLPKETMVIGVYKSEQFSSAQNQWIENPDVKIEITVEELPQGHKIVETKSKSSGRFTFTSMESGDHAICLAVVSNSWFDSTKTRLTLDMDFDDPTDHHDHSAEGVSTLVRRVHELNERVEDIQIEQNAQRVSEIGEK
ncbi:emp24/gp25L/p24 family/GOLD-domain-containing protein [Cokeromyces recurvatus]|uniref:emp24/gp25L/p24 family/GOLD-domain-containing protein n=1 Tax=Cokeromyces recurvatus TaxID=90255 RepID=UPI00221E8D62|nr:emp24/gp25L/p24 family/GOLD-domain-containing protein [Cokeromyces recurvatus]KAI7906551.1 emp24/gp25L/p24 family/GOLD-domain-containing protein [Cokeromyces recurvatus]